MSPDKPQDPVKPLVTFDNYVIPGTVKTQTRPNMDFRVNGAVVAVTAISFLTFVLGVMVTLKFISPAAQDLAERQPQSPAPHEPAADETVTRMQGADLLSPAQAPALARPAALEETVIQALQPKRTVGKLTEEEHAEKARQAVGIISRNKMRMLREGVLAGVYTVTAKTDGGQKRLVLETVNAEMTRESTGLLLLEAAKRGDIEIPAALNTSEGEVDLDTLLFNLIQTSLANDGTPEGAEAAREMSRRAFAASSAKTQQVKGQRVYTVERGDSLGYISLQFYGRPNAYMRIFEANREVLQSPDQIQTGQRLIIPG